MKFPFTCKIDLNLEPCIPKKKFIFQSEDYAKQIRWFRKPRFWKRAQFCENKWVWIADDGTVDEWKINLFFVRAKEKAEKKEKLDNLRKKLWGK